MAGNQRFKDMGNYVAMVSFFLWAIPRINMGYGVAFPLHYPPTAREAPTLRGTTCGEALHHSADCPGNSGQSGTIARAQLAIARAIARHHCPDFSGLIAARTKWLPWDNLGKNQVRWNA